jgi:hypothetical protein
MPGNELTVIIGGEAIAVPPINFAALRRAWPAIQALPRQTNALDQAAAVVEILAAAFRRTRPELTAEAIEERLEGTEFLELIAALPALLEQSGLVPKGEAMPEARPATSPGTTLSPSSSPPA